MIIRQYKINTKIKSKIFKQYILIHIYFQFSNLDTKSIIALSISVNDSEIIKVLEYCGVIPKSLTRLHLKSLRGFSR